MKQLDPDPQKLNADPHPLHLANLFGPSVCREKLSELYKLLESPSSSLTGGVLKRHSSLDEGPPQKISNTAVPALGKPTIFLILNCNSVPKGCGS